MHDYTGRKIKQGDTLAYANARGSNSASLETRYVYEVWDDCIKVGTLREPPQDKRLIGTIRHTDKVIII